MENRKVIMIGLLGHFHYKKKENILYLSGVKEISKFSKYYFTQIFEILQFSIDQRTP